LFPWDFPGKTNYILFFIVFFIYLQSELTFRFLSSQAARFQLRFRPVPEVGEKSSSPVPPKENEQKEQKEEGKESQGKEERTHSPLLLSVQKTEESVPMEVVQDNQNSLLIRGGSPAVSPRETEREKEQKEQRQEEDKISPAIILPAPKEAMNELLSQNFDAVSRPAVLTLSKYLQNIANHPKEEKYRVIKPDNKIFQEKVVPAKGSLLFLAAVGFVEKKEQPINKSIFSGAGNSAATTLLGTGATGPSILVLDQNNNKLEEGIAALDSAMNELEIPDEERPRAPPLSVVAAPPPVEFDPFKSLVFRQAVQVSLFLLDSFSFSFLTDYSLPIATERIAVHHSSATRTTEEKTNRIGGKPGGSRTRDESHSPSLFLCSYYHYYHYWALFLF
jgi:hypothetical protein